MTYSDEFSPKKWSYTKMNEIMEGLAEQFYIKENLNRGLRMNIFLYE